MTIFYTWNTLVPGLEAEATEATCVLERKPITAMPLSKAFNLRFAPGRL